MRRFAPILICWLVLIAPAWADYTEGAIAYIAGNYETAVREFRPLADQGDTNAQFMLGLMYVEGRGVPQDYAEALKWYRLAAAQGDAVAQLNLGVMYDNGRGAPQDYAEAVRWYSLAAEQGYAEAQFMLGAMYTAGAGVPQDSILAHMWYNLTAAQGDKIAAALRDTFEKEMTPADVSAARRLAREWLAKHGKAE